VQPSQQFDPLQPDLREAAETLEKALAEACGVKAARDADTGELIKVEEMLALASEAARRAISIRRKARLEAEAAAARGEALAPAPLADQSASASHRPFEDKRGVRWDVWAVYPEGRPSQLSALPGPFQSGWLVFESASEKRRLSPIPTDWQTLEPRALEQLCDQAEIAAGRARGQVGGAGEDVPPRGESR
jgi:hypothetical protein